METTNTILIHAPLENIFDLAARVEDWGELLPHYRYVKLTHREGNRKWVRMSAWRDFVPVTWTAICTVEPGQGDKPGSITFRHIRGLVRGMEVEWWFKPDRDAGDVLVGISHHLEKPPFPTRILGPRLVESVVGNGFIGHIAGKTLRRMKELAEAQAAVSEPGPAKIGRELEEQVV
jgi:aromatase